MKITPSAISAVVRGIVKVFEKNKPKRVSQHKVIAMEVPSTGSVNVYRWLVKSFNIRKWVGDKVVHKFDTEGHTIANEPYEESFSVTRAEIADDELYNANIVAKKISNDFAFFPHKLVFDALEKGETIKAYDEEPYFATNHKYGENTISNLHTLALTADNYETVALAMIEQKGDDDENLGIEPDTIIVPKALEKQAKRLFLTEKDKDGNINPLYKEVEIVVVKSLKDKTAWYLIDSTQDLMPIILQIRQKPEFANSGEDFTKFRMKGLIEFTGDARYGVGFTLPSLCHKSKPN